MHLASSPYIHSNCTKLALSCKKLTFEPVIDYMEITWAVHRGSIYMP